MIHDHLEFHNVEKLQPDPGFQGWKLQRFPESAGRLIQALHSRQPKRMIFVNNLLPNYADFSADGMTLPSQRKPVFNQRVRQIVGEINSPLVQFIDGRELLSALGGLTSDLLHPSAYGHMAIGEKFADRDLCPAVRKACECRRPTHGGHSASF